MIYRLEKPDHLAIATTSGLQLSCCPSSRDRLLRLEGHCTSLFQVMVQASSLLLSRSHQDVADVAREPVPTQSKIRLGGSSLSEISESRATLQTACQEHENEPAEVVIVCEPEGTSLMMGGLHPRHGWLALFVCLCSRCLRLLRGC